jgi:hypothetical protein
MGIHPEHLVAAAAPRPVQAPPTPAESGELRRFWEGKNYKIKKICVIRQMFAI